MQQDSTSVAIRELASRLHVVDALVFRRVSASTWVHLGGLGRGRGWAGIVEIDECSDILARLLPADPGDIQTFRHLSPERVLGPYYAVSGALVRVSNDVLVVLGNPDSPLADGSHETHLRELAHLINNEVDEVAPSKRLADELEVLHAIRAITAKPPADLTVTLRHILDVSLASLSCEFGALRDGDGHTVWTDPKGSFAGDPSALAQVLDELDSLTQGNMLCLQGAIGETLAATKRMPAIYSVLAVRLPLPAGGLLVVAHTDVARGFTNLCQHLAGQLADAASVVAHTAALRDELHNVAEQQHRVARTDVLTGLQNRLAWNEGLELAQRRLDDGHHLSVILVDVDGLKMINDHRGHDAGDDALRDCAAILRRSARHDDLVARLGGDEFGILLPVDESSAHERVNSLRRALEVRDGDHRVTASVGLAFARPGDRVLDSVRAADKAMYEQKLVRRGTLPPSSLMLERPVTKT